MLITDFPGCCTAKVFCRFGPEEGHETGGQEWDPKTKLKEDLVEQNIALFVDKLNHLKRTGMAVVFATTTNKQTNTEEALARVGFYVSGAVDKTQHPKTKVTAWFMPLNEWNPEDVKA